MTESITRRAALAGALPAEKERRRRVFIMIVEDQLAEAERDILAGIEGAVSSALFCRELLENARNPPPPVPPPEPKMTAAEYFEQYGLPAHGRA